PHPARKHSRHLEPQARFLFPTIRLPRNALAAVDRRFPRLPRRALEPTREEFSWHKDDAGAPCASQPSGPSITTQQTQRLLGVTLMTLPSKISIGGCPAPVNGNAPWEPADQLCRTECGTQYP